MLDRIKRRQLGLSVTSNFPLISDDDETPVLTARTSIDNPRRSLILNSPFPNKKVKNESYDAEQNQNIE